MSQVDPRAINEAAQWLALLQSGHASPEELQAFIAWRDSNPRHGEIVSRMGGGLKQLPVETLRSVPRAALLNSVNAPPSRRKFLGKSLTTLAFTAIGLSLGRLYGYVPLPGELQTSTGERHIYTLEDGSTLTLDARTRVSVSFNGRERLLTLDEGELQIDVAHDGRRPFVVETEHGRMRALGTRFLVAHRADATRLVMLHSQVEITTRSGLRQIATAGQSVRFNQSGYMATLDASGAESAWVDGVLQVRDTALQEVIEQLRRYRRGIIVLDPRIAGLRISGVYFLDDSDKTLRLLERSLPVTVRYRTSFWVDIEPRI